MSKWEKLKLPSYGQMGGVAFFGQTDEEFASEWARRLAARQLCVRAPSARSPQPAALRPA